MQRSYVFSGVAVVLAALMGTAAVGEPHQVLHPFVTLSDGSLGYDTTREVPLYPGSAQSVQLAAHPAEQERAFASAWVATVSNLNFPRVDSAEQYAQEYDRVLGDFVDWNMNAVIFQVRPQADAFYRSAINPWSTFLTGRQGQDPGFDPLDLMVARTHEEGMEFHAWLNPYRVTVSRDSDPAVLTGLGLSAEEVHALSVTDYIAALVEADLLAPTGYAALHPEEVLRFDGKLFLDPGLPAVRQHVADTVAELVSGYDIDAIHFDDYFYPYRITVDGETVLFGEAGEDRATFEAHGITAGYPDTAAGVEQWRRDNVSALITQVGEVIREHNASRGSAVQLGVSPFGIWEHQELHPAGSHTPVSSSQTYSGSVFADTRRWVEEELVDYLVPQIYWSFDQAAAPYGELAQWWSTQAEHSRVQIYTGHALYKHVTNGGWETAWLNPHEVANQMRFNALLPGIHGSVLFSYNDMIPSDTAALPGAQVARHEAKNAAITHLRSEAFADPHLVPEKSWLGDGAPQAPLEVTLSEGRLDWDAADPAATRWYAVRAQHAETGTGEWSELVDVVWGGGAGALGWDLPADSAQSTRWSVSAVNAAGQESQAVVAVEGHVPTPTPTPTAEPSATGSPSPTGSPTTSPTSTATSTPTHTPAPTPGEVGSSLAPEPPAPSSPPNATPATGALAATGIAGYSVPAALGLLCIGGGLLVRRHLARR
ncbi:glycoside hydrolase family 10 protein [Serinibacter salmoneus]|uniref:Glycosyl hydrolase family 10 n=1 Tax=Serinibacter salmoneus TaxID=556530 RepID=A0A2A9D109_9MICO|nr:family 10 glycosylhydrolase [Serinibacter salmoneus]PFG20066.1 glycosyl hydrolase family 10 [Serinibacter salmoneus]